MTVLLVLVAILVVAHQLRRLRRELGELQAEVSALSHRLERYRRAPDAPALRAEVATGQAADEASGTASRDAHPFADAAAGAARPFPEVEPGAGRRFAEVQPEVQPAAAAQAFADVSGLHPRPAAAEPLRAGAEPASAVPEREQADLETRLGTTWTLRIGLGAITVAVGLFARTIVPNLTPALKVVLAYAGALGLVAIGRVFEQRLARFGRPVMAGGLAIGFFVSFAAHFVPAMRAVPLVASLLWMAAGVSAILALAARWRSEPTAGLAIVLGHLSAYVAAGDADSYSLVVILFLSVAAVVLLWRHDWLPLSLVAVVAAYASHLLWGLADRPGGAPARAMLLSLVFLSSYYVVFLAADLLWWRRRADAGAEASADAVRQVLGRSLGPVNVVLYASTAALLYFLSGRPGSLTTFLFAVGATQFALTAIYLRLRNPDWTLYPALGTIFITIGFASALDALSLDVVLAAEALVLLVAAHRTGLRVFHVLAQSVLLTSFVHYVLVPPGAATLALFIGGVLIALAYFTQALLEEHWYGTGGWHAGAAPAGLAGLIAARFDAEFRSLTPYLAHAHALGGALILVREAERFLGAGAATTLLLGAAALLGIGGVVRRSTPLLLAYAVTHVGATLVALGAPAAWEWRLLAVPAASLLLPLGLLAGARRILSGTQLRTAALLGHATVATALLLVPQASPVDGSLPVYLASVAIAALAYAYADYARAIYFNATSGTATVAAWLGAIAGVVAVIVITDATAEFVGPATARRGAWLTSLSALLLGAAAWRRDTGFYLAGFLMLVVGAVHGWLGAATAPLGSMVLIAVITFAVAIVQDYGGARRLAGGEPRLALATTTLAYVLGASVLWTLFLARLGEPWYVLAVAGVALAIHGANARAPNSTGRDFAILLLAAALFVEFTSVIDPLTPGTLALLGCALLVATSALALERLIMLGPRGHDLFPPAPTATALVAAAALLALIALDTSAWRGGAYATIGYSLTAATLMTLGFLARSARHRRIALAVFALTLARVFIVDTRALSDTGRTLAFLVLGVSLVAVAWLYSRFATRIREWL